MARVRKNKIGSVLVLVGAMMTGTYVIAVNDDRDTISDACKFNTEFLSAVRARSTVTNDNEDAQNALINGFATYVLSLKTQDKRTVQLFKQFRTSSAKRDAYLKANPLPPIPDDPC